MFFYLDQLNKLGTKIFFDPGQQISTMNKEEFNLITKKAHYLIVNSHEFSLFKKISGEGVFTGADYILIKEKMEN